MSFSDIGAIIKREFGQEDVSKDAQIFKLFEKGTKPVSVAIKFNMSANEVQRLHREYRSLCETNQLNKIYDELGDKIESLVQLYCMYKPIKSGQMWSNKSGEFYILQ